MVRIAAARRRDVNNHHGQVPQSRVDYTPTFDRSMMHSVVGVGVEVLEGSSGYLDAVCDSHSFYQMAADALKVS